MSINTTKQLHPEFDSGEDTAKTGEHTMTNREWLMILSDEEVARFIHISCPHDYCEWSCRADNDCLACITNWLKAEHREVSE